MIAKKCPLGRNVMLSDLWPRNDFFIVIIKNRNFDRNVDSCSLKSIFLYWSKNIYPLGRNVDIRSEVRRVGIESRSRKTLHYKKKKMHSSSNVDICGDMGKKRFFQSDLRKTLFFTKHFDVLGNMGKKPIYKWSQNIEIILV